jgi:NitT/TauT family transport system substrate-binding protein
MSYQLKLPVAICGLLMLISGAYAQDLPVLKVAEGARNFNVLPVYVAERYGYFKDEGIKVDLITLKGGPAAAGALLSGDVDIAITIIETAIKLRQQGNDVKVIGVLQDHNPCVLVVRTDDKATNISELKGRSIGVTAIGSLTETVLRGYVNKSGLSMNDYKIVAFGQPATVNTALERGDIEAAVSITPFLTSLLQSKKGRILFDFRDQIYPSQSLVALSSAMAGPKKASIEKFVRAVQKGTTRMYADREAAVAAATQYFPNVDKALLEAAVVDDTSAHKMFASDLKVSRQDFTTWQDSLIKNGVLKEPAKFEDVFSR